MKWYIVVVVSQKMKMRKYCKVIYAYSQSSTIFLAYTLQYICQKRFFFFLRVLCSHSGCRMKKSGKADLLSCKDFLDFPGSPVIKTPCFYFRGTGSIPGWGTKILHATWHSQKKKKNQISSLDCFNNLVLLVTQEMNK